MSTSPPSPVAQPPEARQRSALRVFTATVLASEAFVVFFATLVAIGLDMAEPAVVWTMGLGGSLLCLILAGLVRGRIGLVLGSVVQLLLIASGVIIPMMYVVGGVFTAIWIVALRLGSRIDRERAQRARAEVDDRPSPPRHRPVDQAD